MGSPRKEEELERMRQQLHDLGEQMDKERQAAANPERLKREKENKKFRAQIKQREKEKQTASVDKERHEIEKENKKLRAQIEVHNPLLLTL